MKKILTILVGALICTSVFTSCTKQEKKKTLMVGMVTDAGTIDDKSFVRDSSLKLPYLRLSQNMRMLNSLLSTEMHILQTRGMLRTVRTQSESASLKTNPHSLQVLRLLSR